MLLQKGKASTSISISFLATNISKYSVMGNYLMVETLKDAKSFVSHHHLAGDQINTIVSCVVQGCISESLTVSERKLETNSVKKSVPKTVKNLNLVQALPKIPCYVLYECTH